MRSSELWYSDCSHSTTLKNAIVVNDDRSRTYDRDRWGKKTSDAGTRGLLARSFQKGPEWRQR